MRSLGWTKRMLPKWHEMAVRKNIWLKTTDVKQGFEISKNGTFNKSLTNIWNGNFDSLRLSWIYKCVWPRNLLFHKVLENREGTSVQQEFSKTFASLQSAAQSAAVSICTTSIDSFPRVRFREEFVARTSCPIHLWYKWSFYSHIFISRSCIVVLPYLVQSGDWFSNPIRTDLNNRSLCWYKHLCNETVLYSTVSTDSTSSNKEKRFKSGKMA